MTNDSRDLYTIAEAAQAWGISKQAVYQRLNKLNKQGFVVEQAKRRYITRQGIESIKEAEQGVEQSNSTIQPTLNQLEQVVESLKTKLNDAESRALSLQATVDAQQAHIDSLKQALDREQALHMASLQQRLPAPGKGFFAWLKGRKGTE